MAGLDRLEMLVAELKSIGLIGIEAIYSTYNTAEERQIRGLASKYDLKISGGSDFHGANKPKIDLGTGWGKLAVMGCVVNGPGEAKEADIGIAGGVGVGLLIKKGEIVKKVPEDQLLDTLREELLHWEG